MLKVIRWLPCDSISAPKSSFLFIVTVWLITDVILTNGMEVLTHVKYLMLNVK